MRAQRVEHFEHPIVYLGLHLAVRLIIRAEHPQRGPDLLLRSVLGHRAADELLCSISHKSPRLLKASLRVPQLAQHIVRAVAQILERVEQRAVHIKKNCLICHLPFLFSLLFVILPPHYKRRAHKVQGPILSYLYFCTIAHFFFI